MICLQNLLHARGTVRAMAGIFPAIFLLSLLFIPGLAIVIWGSFIADGEVSFHAYRSLFMDSRFFSSLFFSCSVALVSTAITVILAILTALKLQQRGPFLLVFYQLPLAVPYLVAAVGILLLFSQSGLISRVMFASKNLEQATDFPILVHNGYGFGIILTYVWKQIPFLGILIISMLRTLVPEYGRVASNLGAGRWQSFRYVTLPLLMPAIIPGSIILLAHNFGAFEVPYVLGRPFPSMSSILAYRWYTDSIPTQHILGLAMSVCCFVISTLLVFIYMFLTWRFPLRQE